MTGWPWLGPFLDQGLWVVYLVLALAAFLKYTAPIVPGDTVLLAGIFLVGARNGSWLLAGVCVASGGTAGAWIAYLWGGRFGRLLLRGRRLRRAILKVESLLGRWGYWPLVLNRFIPYVRPAIFPAAGLLRMRGGPVALSALASNVLFGAFVVALGYSAGKRYARFLSLFRIYQVWLGLLVLALLSLAAFAIYRATRGPSNGGPAAEDDGQGPA